MQAELQDMEQRWVGGWVELHKLSCSVGALWKMIAKVREPTVWSMLQKVFPTDLLNLCKNWVKYCKNWLFLGLFLDLLMYLFCSLSLSFQRRKQIAAVTHFSSLHFWFCPYMCVCVLPWGYIFCSIACTSPFWGVFFKNKKLNTCFCSCICFLEIFWPVLYIEIV